MDIRDYNESQYVDIFGDQASTTVAKPTNSFSNDGLLDSNIADVSSVTDTTTQILDSSTTETTTLNSDVDVDISADVEEEKGKPGRPKKHDFSDLTGYFEDRIKAGKFIPIEEEVEGQKKVFIPSTPEEFDEVIDMQVEYKVGQEKQKLENTWYQSKSPAWQAVAKYAEYTDDPADVVPFITGIKTLESVANLNEEEIEGAERIVRARMQQRGDDNDVIEEQIEALKTTDKLISTAKKYKPAILQEEKKNLQQMMAQKEKEEEEYNHIIYNIRENAIKAIESPVFGKIKLKNDEKMAVYELIGEPDKQSKGFRIYSEIDKLFESGKFDTLAKIALLMANEESFTNYISNTAADKTAAGLERKLRLATDSRGGSSRDVNTNDDAPSIQRNRFNNNNGGFSRR